MQLDNLSKHVKHTIHSALDVLWSCRPMKKEQGTTNIKQKKNHLGLRGGRCYPYQHLAPSSEGLGMLKFQCTISLKPH